MENKQVVQSIYDAFARGDAPTVLAALSPEVDWNEAEGGPYADGNPYNDPGRVGAEVFGRILSDYQGFTVSPQKLIAEGEQVVALGRYSGTRATSGAALDAQFVHVWTVRDGKVTAFQQYTDTAQWTRLA